jgi:hypothetical protein
VVGLDAFTVDGYALGHEPIIGAAIHAGKKTPLRLPAGPHQYALI